MGKDGGWIALVTALSQVLAAIVGKTYLGSDSRLLRKIERDASLLKTLPDNAKDVMEALIFYEVNQHALRRMRRAARKIDGSVLVAILIIATITACADWGLAYMAMHHGWGWWIPFGILTIFGYCSVWRGLDSYTDTPMMTMRRLQIPLLHNATDRRSSTAAYRYSGSPSRLMASARLPSDTWV